MITKDILHAILQYSVDNKYPDIHLSTNQFPYMRNNSGEIFPIKELEIVGEVKTDLVLDKETIKNIIIELIGYTGMDKFTQELEMDSSYIFGEYRFRVNCYKDTDGYSTALRLIPTEIPTMESLNLGDTIKELCRKGKGLLLVTGPTGSGKSTNLAAMIDYINQTQKKHILTIEDPVEFIFKNKESFISQREVGNHTKGFAQAMKSALREDPDIIMVGEMRDPETIKAALTLAETGHLVLSTLHTNDTIQSIDRIVDVFPSAQQAQIRMQLAMSLVGIITQRLLPRLDGNGRIPAREILINTDPVKNLIITGKSHQLYSILEVSAKQGMILMDKYLLFLYQKGIISKDILFSYIRDKDGVEMLLGE